MKIFTLIVLLSAFASFNPDLCLAQSRKTGETVVDQASILGSWAIVQIDSSFGHTRTLQFTFNRRLKFVFKMILDGEVKEKYFGTFKIDSLKHQLILISNKMTNAFQIHELTKDQLQLKNDDDPIILSFKRSAE